jgi:glycogen debranching enzyme
MATQRDDRVSSTDDLSTVVEIDGRYYILATSTLADENDRVLKHGESFAIFDRWGDIKPVGLGEEGLFHRGTRHLAGLRLRIGDERPLLLGSTTRHDNSRLTIDVTNPDMVVDGRPLRAGTVHLSRTKVLWAGACHERIEIRNFGQEAVVLPISFRFAADFADIFEVRGMERRARGTLLEPLVDGGRIVLAYDGLDGARRMTSIGFAPAPERLEPREAGYVLELPPGRSVVVELRIDCEDGTRPRDVEFASALARSSAELDGRFDRSARVRTSSELFDDWVTRSLADIVMMTSETADGPYPYAGIPWFSTVFGRDGIITALQTLWVQPTLARGVLKHLAALQATGADAERDAQPGKILHEVRHGEMAELKEIPFGCYYGSHDSTPLFVVLAGAYYRQTSDVDLARELWPNVEAALAWMDGPGDPDGDGFLEYARQRPTGLVQQGWKDSNDSVFHADGELAEGPLALCEIQGYAYAAQLAAADLAEALGLDARAAQLRAQAEALRVRFEAAFWDDELGTYGIALDGDKRLCRVLTSNPGHCLWTGIASAERAVGVAEQLTGAAMYSGWGIRTLAAGQPRYNPMSYHNGSVWPHDNAIAAMGMARYGHRNAAASIIHGLFDASRHFDLARMPELFCGFTRRSGEGPTHYPVACAPQAWAAGAVFMLLQACLGLEVDARASTLHISNARLPLFLDHLELENVAVGDARLDLRLQRQRDGVGVDILDRRGSVAVVNVK